MLKEAEAGADGTIFSSISVALSTLLPGLTVPGLQNCNVEPDILQIHRTNPKTLKRFDA